MNFIFKLLCLSHLYCLDFASSEFNSSAAPVVKTVYGQVQGFTALNGTVDVFFGIPYARPPLGALRFEKPKPPLHWKGILSAQFHKGGCYPHATPDFLNGFLQSGNASEDCLHMNIFTPHKRGNSLLPVLVLIHGGGFEIGSSLQFANYTDIGTNFVLHGIVVVSINYRLGQFGFATTGDGVMPGNLGLWDQTAALQFLKTNIARFGGDPAQITLMGQSAGSASVSALGLSPHSRNLFQRSIQISGSSMSSWVRGSRVANETLALAKALGCPIDCSFAIKQCLQSKKHQELLKGVDVIGQARAEPNCLFFTPHLDGDFFPMDMPELVEQAPPKPTLIGFNPLEWLILTVILGQNSSLSRQMLPASALGNYQTADLLNYIRTHVANAERFADARTRTIVARRIFDFYANVSAANANSVFYVRQYTELISDLLITLPIVDEIQQKVAGGWPIYLYIFNYVNKAGFPPNFPLIESFHINDYNYIIWDPVVAYTFNEQDHKIQAFMQLSVRNFVKSANPSTNGANDAATSFRWPKVKNALEFNHVRVEAPSPSVQRNASEFIKRLTFWKALGEEFPQYDILREIPNESNNYC